MRKIISLLLVLVLCVFAFCGCSKEAENKNETKPQRSEISEEKEPKKAEIADDTTNEEPTYYHSAISGAVIVNQDGSPSFTYKKKCESCGKTENGTNNGNATFGTLHGGYHCPFCNANGQFEIETTQN